MKKSLLFLCICSALFSAGSSSQSEVDSTPSYVKDYNAGVAAQKDKNYEKAIQYYQQVLRQKPDFSDAWNNLGYCYRIIAKTYLTKAGEAYDKAVRYQPKHAQALEYQGEYFIMAGELHYAYHNYQVLKQMKSDEAGELKEKLDAVLKQAKSILKDYNP